MDMKKYVITLLFTLNFGKVWLVKKQKPDWQKDCLNGIGGKVEDNEGARHAALRELKEESGISFPNEDLIYVGYMSGINNDSSDFIVSIFTGVTNEILKTVETEEILLVDISDVKKHRHVENIPTIIEACLYKMKGHSHFNELILNYYK